MSLFREWNENEIQQLLEGQKETNKLLAALVPDKVEVKQVLTLPGLLESNKKEQPIEIEEPAIPMGRRRKS